MSNRLKPNIISSTGKVA